MKDCGYHNTLSKQLVDEFNSHKINSGLISKFPENQVIVGIKDNEYSYGVLIVNIENIRFMDIPVLHRLINMAELLKY